MFIRAEDTALDYIMGEIVLGRSSNCQVCGVSKYQAVILPILLIAVDYIAIIAAEYVAAITRLLIPGRSYLHISQLSFWLICPLIFIIFIQSGQLYQHRMQFWRIVEKLFSSVAYAMLTIVLLLYVARMGNTSRAFVVFLWLFSFVFLIIGRYIIKVLLEHFSFLQMPILIIGAGKTAELLLQGLSEESGIGYRVIGVLEDNAAIGETFEDYPVLGRFSDAERIIEETGIQTVVIAAPGMQQDKQREIVNKIQSKIKNLTIIPNLIGIPMSGIEAEGFFNQKIIVLRLKNNLARPVNKLIKYIFDFVLTFVGTICISPFLLAIYLWIKIDSPGPAIFKHRRIGRDGKVFNCYKFRSMCIDAEEKLQEILAHDAAAKEEWDKDFKLKEDPRITKVGKFLRKRSLDELPQIFNVLRGEMSLVGPRPVIKAELLRYGEYVGDYLMVRPGITGMWQVSGRSNTDYESRVIMDSWYVHNWSFWIDVMLLWRTIKKVIKGEGAY